MHALLQPYPVESNHTCLLVMPLLSFLIIWLAENLFCFEKKSTFNFLVFFGIQLNLYILHIVQSIYVKKGVNPKLIATQMVLAVSSAEKHAL